MVEFLKALFGEGESMTYEQLEAKLTEGGIKPVNLAAGGYISEDKFNGRVNGLTQQVTDLQGQIAQRDTDLAAVREALTAAQADASKLPGVEGSLTALQSKYAQEKSEWEQRMSQQAYEFAIRERANGLNFSSAAAKRDFVRGAIDKGFKMEGDTIQGYDEFVEQYKAADPTAFVAEKPADPDPNQPGKKTPSFVKPGNTPDPQKGVGGFNFHFQGVRAASEE